VVARDSVKASRTIIELIYTSQLKSLQLFLSSCVLPHTHLYVERMSAADADHRNSYRAGLILELLASHGHTSVLLHAASATRALRSDGVLWERLYCAEAVVRRYYSPPPPIRRYAIEQGDEDRLRWLLSITQSSRAGSAIRSELLFYALTRGREGCVRVLLESGASLRDAFVDSIDLNSLPLFPALSAELYALLKAHATASPTALFLAACSRGESEDARALLFQAMPEDDDDGFGCLTNYATKLSAEILQVLSEHPCHDGLEEQFHVAAEGNHGAWVQQLIAKADDVNTQRAALCAALACGLVEEARALLLEDGVGVDAEDCFRCVPSVDIPLRWAAIGVERGHDRGVFDLVADGVGDPSAALYWASRHGLLQQAKEAIAANAELEGFFGDVDESCGTALHAACLMGHAAVARLLCIEFGDRHAANLNLFKLDKAWFPTPHTGRYLSPNLYSGAAVARTPLEFALCYFCRGEDPSAEAATVRALLESGAVVTCLISSSVEVTRLLCSHVKSAWKEQLATQALAAVESEQWGPRGTSKAARREIASVLRDTGADVAAAGAQHLF
jgi:hypothetical protein